MIEKTRFPLKHPIGWFAAGREVACALELLSDVTFKLFVWLCLHAERSRGTVSATSPELARALGKKRKRSTACPRRTRAPRCLYPPGPGRDRLFLERRCVQSSFTAADEKLALTLFRRGVSLIHVEHAILLGAVRKYVAVHGNGNSTPISSLHYFTDLFEEVQQEISTHYWTYIARKVKTFEQTELRAEPGGRRSAWEK
jgi:hypothetical protein